jgi:Uma2 family endonuclease
MPTQQHFLVLGPADRGRSLSSWEYQQAEFERPWNYEREGGRLLVMAPDSPEHDQCSEPIRDLLGAYRLAHPQIVELVVSECWLRVDEGTDRIGDIGVFLAGDRSGLKRPQRVPEMMVEVVSPDRESRERNYVKKRGEYLQLGMLEYVIIDRMRRRVTVYTHDAGHYRKRVLHPGRRYRSPLLPGLEISLSDIL